MNEWKRPRSDKALTPSQDSPNRFFIGFCELHCRVERNLRQKIQIVQSTESVSHTPPVVFFLNTMSGLLLFNRIPTASSSCSRSCLCSSDFVASNMIKMRSAVFAAISMFLISHLDVRQKVDDGLETTCRPRPRPWLAPSTIPGRSSS